MKNIIKLFTLLIIIIVIISCSKKKLIEVVEVPLPSTEEKITIGQPDDVKANEGQFELEKLPYDYNSLSPSIDILTMEMHYSKHYLTHTNNLNKILADEESLKDLSIEDILKKCDGKNSDLKFNAGGYYNHNLFWNSIKPLSGGQPKDTLASAIKRDFGSFNQFKIDFTEVANKHQGAGWAWLLVNKDGKLQVISTPNQDNPLMPKQIVSGKPILNIDIWEHAYYLNYQYKRKNYIDNFFKIINWEKVSERYEEAISK